MVFGKYGEETIKLNEDTYLKLGLNRKEFFKVDIGDVVLDAWMIKPADFDPAKKYPVLFYVHGEPCSSTVQDNWEGVILGLNISRKSDILL
jgi:dipeptidyl aminopeptidase/acylaminoacyl peptidase